MKFKCIVEYEYPVEHKPPVKAELILHGDRVVTDKITPLPKGHGRLIDMKDLRKLVTDYCDAEQLILADREDYLPTIIEADKGE